MSRVENYNPGKSSSFQPVTVVATVVVLSYVVLGIISAVHHEMWRDETEAWLIARDTPLTELFARLHYVGHPCVWFLILKPFATMGLPVQAMQGIHLCIASATIYLVMRYAPFPYIHRILFCFGYFPLFEYNVICRNYAVTVLLLVVTLLYWPRRRTKPLYLGLAVAVMAHTTSHGATISMAFLLVWLLDTMVRWPHDRQRIWLIAVGILTAACGIFLVYLQLQPPADGYWFSKFFVELKQDRITDTLNNYVHGVVPMPRNVPMFWNTSVFDDRSTGVALAAVGIMAVVTLALSDDLVSLWFFLCGTGGLIFLAYAVYPGFLRHHGSYYMVMVAALWLRQLRRPTMLRARRWFSATSAQWLLALALPPLLAIHVLAATKSIAADWQYVFSPARDVAKFLRDHHLEESQLLGSEDAVASTVAAYLPAKRMLYMEGDRWGSFVMWDQKRWDGAQGDKIIERLKRRSSSGLEWVLIMSYSLPDDMIKRHHITSLGQFKGMVDSREANVYLYQYRIREAT